MRWRYVQTGILLLFCFVLGFNIIIPLFDRRSFASARDATYDYNTLETGWGNWNDGGGDCSRYTGGTYAHQGSCAIDIQDDSGYSASATFSDAIDLTGYDECSIDFWFRAVSMDVNEDFWVDYYNGSASSRIATIVIGGGTYVNNVFYHLTYTISADDYTFSATSTWRIQCDASDDSDDVYIDQIYINVSGRMWTPSMVEGYFTFKNTDYTPVYDNMTQGWFSFENTSSWQGSDGYFTFGNITAYETIIDGYFNFANTPAWQGVSGYYTFGNTPSWSGVDGYFTFGNLSANHTIDEGYFTFSNGEWQGITQGWFTFKSVRAWDNLSSGYFTFLNIVNYTNMTQGYFNFSNSPLWHGSQGYFTFANSPTWHGSQGWFSFGNITNYQNMSQGYFNFSNTPQWNGTDGYFTFGNGGWQTIEQGWFTFQNTSTWHTENEGWFTFGNINYTAIIDWYPKNGDIVDPANFSFMVEVEDTNGTPMDITWEYWNGTVWSLFGTMNNVGNGTYYQPPSPWLGLIYNSTYHYRVNVTGTNNDSRDVVFTTPENGLTAREFSMVLFVSMFGLFFLTGYYKKKPSGGTFMLFSGFVLIRLFLLTPFAGIMTLLLVPFAVYIIIIGVKKWLFFDPLTNQ